MFFEVVDLLVVGWWFVFQVRLMVVDLLVQVGFMVVLMLIIVSLMAVLC